MSEDGALLSVRDIDAYYGESHILRGLSMEVESGEICALLGRNGAGKTTTVRSIAGATPPEVRSGGIYFRGEKVTDVPLDDRSIGGIGVVPEERRVFSNLTVVENLHMADVSRNTSNLVGRTVEDPPETVDVDVIYDAFPRLDERRDQLAGTLSGGEQQMLAIGRALRQGPDLLMLDEPYEGLAPMIIESVEEAIRAISELGRTILLVEQNAVAAMNIADQCYVIDQGQVVFDGDSETLREDHYTRQQYLGV
jgi:branched-chain amino acid transport system ATP-binding protein